MALVVDTAGRRYGESLTDGRVTDEQVIGLVLSRNSLVLDVYGSQYRQVPKWYNFYCGNGAGDFPHFRNNIHIPFTLSYIQTGVSHKVQSTFGAKEFFTFDAPSGEHAYAESAAALIHEQLNDINIFGKAIDFYTSAEMYGTGFLQTGWKCVERPRYFRHRYMGQEQIVEIPNYKYFDGVDLQVVDMLDARPAPGYSPAQDAPWVIIRYFEDFDTLVEQSQGEYPKWDPAAIRKLKDNPMYQETADEWRRRSGSFRSYTDQMVRTRDVTAKPVEIIELRGLVPREFAVKGDRNVVISIFNSTTVGRYEGNSNFHGHHGLFSYSPLRDPHSIWGLGKIQLVLPMQAAANKLLNAQLDALEIFGTPQFLKGSGIQMDRENLTSMPGRVHEVEGDLTQFQPLVPEMGGLQFISVELEQLSRYMQQATSSTDIVQGLPSNQDRTAREYLGLREQAMGRLALEALAAEKGIIEPVIEQLHQLNIQYLKLPKKLRMIGLSAVQDPITGMPIQQNEQVDIEAMNPDYRVSACGAMQMMGKPIRAQQLKEWISLGTGNQIMGQLTNWVGLSKELARAMDLRPDAVLNTQLPMLNQFAEEAGMDPEQAIAAASQGADMLPMLAPGPAQQSEEPVPSFTNSGY